jgi:hypothetical protein
MSFWRRAGHATASVLASCFLVAGLCGSSCTAAVCVEHCDPCFEQCLCHTQCQHAVLDLQTSHKLSKYRLEIADERDGTTVRTISDISGLSLDLADGVREHTSADFVRFAAGVIEFNGLLLQSRRGLWTPQPVETVRRRGRRAVRGHGEPGCPHVPVRPPRESRRDRRSPPVASR